jgi:exonuclease III
MPAALKLLTWNVQQLPPIAGGEDAEGRAMKVAQAILAMPPREQPDVIVFNEVFDETGRETLVESLESTYSHAIKQLDHPGWDLEEDSGLMLLSKRPFLKFKANKEIFYWGFDVDSGTDAWAAKGVAVVRVAGPLEPVTIAFTHLQASYDPFNTEHSQIRSEQLAAVRAALRKVVDPTSSEYASCVVVGDLNIKGDPDEMTGEASSVFAGSPGTFGEDFLDGWRFAMHPPKDSKDYDPGYTQRDTKTYMPNRFDYQCTQRGANADIRLVPQQMSTPLRLPSEVTDHWGLLAHLHRDDLFSMPSSALPLLKKPATNHDDAGSHVWPLAMEIAEPDMYQWVYVAEAGTFSAFPEPQLEVHAFRRSDFTHALAPTELLQVSELPPNIQMLLERQGHELDEGAVFASREPFFLRIRGTSESFTGQAAVEVIRHAGESAATAIVLLPHRETKPRLPAGGPLGLNDKCYFRADRPDRYTGMPYADRFVLDNPAFAGVSLELCDEVEQPIESLKASEDTIPLARTGAAETVYLVLKRDDVNETDFTLTWRSPLTYLALDESLRLHVDEETGPDAVGADEFKLSVDIDGDPVYVGSWDDADTGEDWPGFGAQIRTNVLARKGQDRWVAFTEGIWLSPEKTDGVSAHGNPVGVVGPLRADELDVKLRIVSMAVPGDLSDGQLMARMTLSRFPLV